MECLLHIGCLDRVLMFTSSLYNCHRMDISTLGVSVWECCFQMCLQETSRLGIKDKEA